MGGEVQKNSFAVLKPNTGRLVSIVGIEDKQLAAEKNISAESIWLQPNGEQLQKIADLMAAGKVKSIIGEVFPFSRQGIYDAHALKHSLQKNQYLDQHKASHLMPALRYTK